MPASRPSTPPLPAVPESDRQDKPGIVLDLFAGPGGWDEGARPLGLHPIGVEWDDAACRTAMKAGHARVRADVASLPTEPMVGKVWGLIASPPCQAWSMAGKRKGEQDRAHCHELADRMADGDDSTDWTAWEDRRSPLVCQPVRWVRELRPEWVALEEVPAVASLWEQYARIFRRWGYSTWTGDLNSADYGVPQTRTRRILIGSRTRLMQPPSPTHGKDPHADLFGEDRLPWVSMADALGWGATERPVPTVTSGGAATGGAEPLARGGREALARERREGRWLIDRRTNSKDGRGGMAPTVPVAMDRPATTLTSKAGTQWLARPEWAYERPATTIVGSFCPDVVAAPGYRTTVSRQDAEDSVKVTFDEAAALQSFPSGYPWQGTKGKKFEQIGNAIPPLLATHVLAAVTGIALPAAQEVAA